MNKKNTHRTRPTQGYVVFVSSSSTKIHASPSLPLFFYCLFLRYKQSSAAIGNGCHVFCSSSCFLTRNLFCPASSFSHFGFIAFRSFAHSQSSISFRLHSFQHLAVQRLLIIFGSPACRIGLRAVTVFVSLSCFEN